MNVFWLLSTLLLWNVLCDAAMQTTGDFEIGPDCYQLGNASHLHHSVESFWADGGELPAPWERITDPESDSMVIKRKYQVDDLDFVARYESEVFPFASFSYKMKAKAPTAQWLASKCKIWMRALYTSR